MWQGGSQGGGSEPQETLLWSTNATSFAQQSVTISQAYTDFDYIKVTYVPNTTSAKLELIIPTSVSSGGMAARVSAVYYYRPFNFESSTSLWIGNCYQYASATPRANCLPREVIGIKTNVTL